jgi:hypothetical protein
LEFIVKTAWLLGLCVVSTAFAKEIPKDEDYTRMLSKPALTTLADLARVGVNAGSSALDLWSGSYWPMFQGSLGFRYRNAAVWALNGETTKYENYVLAHATPVATDELSPAEKYDLLVGDALKTFTATQWKNGVDNRSGLTAQVPTWRGICDGWSAATQTWPRPAKAVTLTSANGTPVTFYPEDIKALGSQLHAKGVKTVTFLGRRCTGSTGHITGACDETNPGALHLALANRVGVEKKSFVVDASPGKEVWNYPVKSYEFTYSNPLTGVSGDWRSSRVNIVGNEERLVKGKKRAKTAVSVVGVTAKVIIADMRDANTLAYDDESSDKVMELDWSYDLELDAQGKIVGGEWHEKNGPDFIWAPREDSRPVSVAERRTRLSYNGVITPGVQAAALLGSAQAQPLAAIVDELFRRSAE